MNKKGIIIGIIILGFTFLALLIGILVSLNNNNSNLQNENDIEKNTADNIIKYNNTENNEKSNDNLNSENTKEINSIKITIVNTPNDVLDKIKNRDDFVYCLKKFVYQSQKTEITQFEYIHNIILNNKCIIYYRANDDIKSYIEVVYDLTTNKTTAEIAKD